MPTIVNETLREIGTGRFRLRPRRMDDRGAFV
jgi:hypothetical protein